MPGMNPRLIPPSLWDRPDTLAGPAGEVGKLVDATQERGWDVQPAVTPAALDSSLMTSTEIERILKH
jgi:hypothetical protein